MLKLANPKLGGGGMETMKSDLVKPPGTPVCVGTTPPVTVSEAVNSHSVDCSSGEICSKNTILLGSCI